MQINSAKIIHGKLVGLFIATLIFAPISWACSPVSKNCPQDKLLSGKSQSVAAKSIKPSYVCMVNNSIMEKPQIPVTIDGKTYYGCCSVCIERFKTDFFIRFSKDPVTGQPVNKADAFIATGHKGEALYFENIESYKAYIEGSKK